MKRTLLVVAVMALLGTLGMFVPASAGTGSATSCGGTAYQESRTQVIGNPVTLGVAVWPFLEGYPYPDEFVRVCYSTSPAGSTAPTTTGGSVEARADRYARGQEYEHDHWVKCTPQSNPSTVAPSCFAGEDNDEDQYRVKVCATGTSNCVSTAPTAGSTYPSDGPLDPTQHSDYTVWFSIPVTVCAPGCTSTTLPLGKTGLLIGTVDRSSTPPTGTGTGAGYTVRYVSYCVNGTCTPLTPDTYVGLGIDKPADDVSPFYDLYGAPRSITCFAPICVPGTANIHLGPTLAVVQVGSSRTPVVNPAGGVNQCVNGWELLLETALGIQYGGICDPTVSAVAASTAQPANGSKLAVSGTGDATSQGGVGAVTGTGDADANGGVVAVAVDGHARDGTVNYGGRGAG